MKDRRARRLLVLDRDDRLVGILSLGDLVWRRTTSIWSRKCWRRSVNRLAVTDRRKGSKIDYERRGLSPPSAPPPGFPYAPAVIEKKNSRWPLTLVRL